MNRKFEVEEKDLVDLQIEAAVDAELTGFNIAITDPANMEALSEYELKVLRNRLLVLAWRLGTMMDRVYDIDPNSGSDRPYGATSNRQSYTYKMRKAAGFSYP